MASGWNPPTLQNCHPYFSNMDENFEEWVEYMGVASGPV